MGQSHKYLKNNRKYPRLQRELTNSSIEVSCTELRRFTLKSQVRNFFCWNKRKYFVI